MIPDFDVLICQGKVHGKQSAISIAVCHCDFPLMALDDTMHGGKPHTGAVAHILNFILSGDVRPVADFSATVISLTGSAGTDIRQIIRISPVAENRFRITGIAPEDGKNLKYELIETTSGEAPAYELTVCNLKQDKGWYRDKFHILTDSTISPEILIPVLGLIRERR